MAVPRNVVTNEVIASRLGVDAQWITKRTGVVERRIAEPDETGVELATEAAHRSLSLAQVAPEDVQLVLVATVTPDRILPNMASLIVGRAGLGNCAGSDLAAACTGWLTGVGLAAAQVETGRADCVLVIGVDVLSRLTDVTDRATAPLFADGAGAVVVTPCEGPSRIGPVLLGTEPAGADWIYADHEESKIRMHGGQTFAAAVDHLSDATRAAATAAGYTLDDIDVFAFHQANARIIRSVGERLGLPPERVAVCIDKFGNASSATIPMALAKAAGDGRLAAGTKVLMAAFGAGFTWGAAAVEWGAPLPMSRANGFSSA